MIQTVVFDTKPYDREALERASAGARIDWRFMDFRLSPETATAARGRGRFASSSMTAPTARASKPSPELGVKHVALRCAGFQRR